MIFFNIFCSTFVLQNIRSYTMNQSHICPREFVEKYKLVPKQLRLKFISFISTHIEHIERSTPDCWKFWNNTDAKSYEEEYENFCTELFWLLNDYEQQEQDDYEMLFTMLHENVYAGRLSVFTDVANAFIRYMKWHNQGRLVLA